MTDLELLTFVRRLVSCLGYACRYQNVSLANKIHKQALEHYEDLADIKRAIVHTTTLQPDVRTYVQHVHCVLLTHL